MTPASDPLTKFASVFPVNRGLYYGGEWHPAIDGQSIAVTSPSSGASLGSVAAGTAADLDLAVAAAHVAQAEWRKTGPMVRTKAVRAAAERIRAHRADLAMLDVLDCGNPVMGMEFDVDLGTTLMDFFAGLATEVKGATIPVGGDKLNYVQREPIGVVGRIIPFNHPMMFMLTKMAAPIIAGNAVILKPSEHTPLAALRIAELIGDLFPAGLLSVLNGTGELGAAMSGHPDIGNISVVGSAATGRAVMRQGADTLKRLTLELGGKNALIVFPDADVKKVIAGAVKGMNLGWTGGQSCGSTSRALVHDDLYDEVVAGLTAEFDKIKVGDPMDRQTEMGCMSMRGQYEKVLRLIEQAKSEGARMASGGPVPDELGDGLFVRPTLFADVTPDMTIASEEVFGPVLSVMRWSDYDTMMKIVNSVEYGLTGSIWTRDLETAFRAVNDIEAGYVWVNNSSDHSLGAPFGGFKQSGIGREECLEEILGYTEQKNVSVTLSG